MKPGRVIGLVVGLIVLIGAHGAAFSQGPPPAPLQEQPEVLTRGPVHEAFAEPVNLEIEAGLMAPIAPPPNIQEIPPDERPQGEQFAWVPGYWAWDADRNTYIWVSACWRAAPPNMYWVPGYWAQVVETQEAPRGGVEVGAGGVRVRVGWGVNIRVGRGVDINVGGRRAAPAKVVGWEWVSGFWASAGEQEIEYLPAPPTPVDLQPPGPPPSADSMWVPGCWYWHEDQYVRRPGYWLRQQPGWVWEPSHYRWTPRGYVFEAGHWDYSLDRRGVLFAPVYLPRSVYAREGFSYSPSIAIDVGVLSANLFAYPRYGHYYFGDYYDDAYLRLGIYPQFESERRHTWYDPIYTYDRWHYGRTDNRWEKNRRQEYDRRRSDTSLRPARTYREMETRVAKMPEAQRRSYELAKPLRTIASREASPVRFERINTDARQKIGRQAADTHKLRDERSRWEAGAEDNPRTVEPPKARPPAVADRRPGSVPPRSVRVTRPERVKIPKPPIFGRPGDSRKPEFAPPPKPDKERQTQDDTRGGKRGGGKDKDRGDEPDKDRGRDRDKDKDGK